MSRPTPLASVQQVLDRGFQLFGILGPVAIDFQAMGSDGSAVRSAPLLQRLVRRSKLRVGPAVDDYRRLASRRRIGLGRRRRPDASCTMSLKNQGLSPSGSRGGLLRHAAGLLRLAAGLLRLKRGLFRQPRIQLQDEHDLVRSRHDHLRFGRTLLRVWTFTSYVMTFPPVPSLARSESLARQSR